MKVNLLGLYRHYSNIVTSKRLPTGLLSIRVSKGDTRSLDYSP